MFSAARHSTAHGQSRHFFEFLPQEQFVNALRLERRRSERSGNTFLLALINLDHPDGPKFQSDSIKEIVSGVHSVLRDTDVVGWYEHGAVLGIIFTHLHDASRIEAKNALDSKLRNAIAEPSWRAVRISYHFFPEIDGQSVAADPALYPDKDSHIAPRSARILKRAIDIVASTLFLLMFSPVFLVIALLIKLNSKGPVLFKQTRVGQYGTAFTFLKFRSMYVNNDPAIHCEYVTQLIAGNKDASSGGTSNRVFKIVDDPRVTNLGRILRRTSMDELPQFINVLRGEMSLVGPRPPVPYEVERYEAWHRRRVMEVKPGITGLWQVNGRSRTTFDEMVRLDIQYARNWSTWLDLKILLRTPSAVFSGEGAY